MATSDSDSDEERVSTPRKVLRTVRPSSGYRPDREMDTVGWGLFLGLAILLVPLLPFLVIVFVVSKVVGFVRRQTA